MGKNESGIDLRHSVLQEIKEKRIKIKSRFISQLEKIGWEGAFLVLLFFGSFFLILIIDSIKQVGLLNFLDFGPLGWKIVLESFPYRYLFLSMGIFLLASYFANRLNFYCSKNISCDAKYLFLIFGSIIFGAIFAYQGVEEVSYLKINPELPKGKVITGKIKALNFDQAVIEENDGEVVMVDLQNVYSREQGFDPKVGQYFQAIGSREVREDISNFQAIQARCYAGD